MAEETFTLKIDSTGAVTSLKRIGDGFEHAGRKAGESGKKVSGFKGELIGLAKNLVGPLSVAAAVISVSKAIISSVKEFAAYEKALVGVAKTTNLAGAELQKFSEDIIKTSERLKGAAGSKELLAIAQAAGQLGVSGSENLLKFSETIAKLGLASDLAGETAATTLTRILTVTGEGVAGIDIFASQIVSLGNNFAATESEIARVATEVSRATSVFGVSAGNAAALSAALKSVGVQAELGGSAVGRAFRAIDSAVRNGGKEMNDLVKLTGKTREVLIKTFQEDSVKAFQYFIEGLGNVKKRGEDTTAELAKFNLKGEEILKVLPVLATRSDLVAAALKNVAEEARNGGQALEKEVGAAVNTLDTKFKNLAQRFDDLQTTFGKKFADEAVLGVNLITDAVNKLNQKIRDTTKQKLIFDIAAGAGGITGATIGAITDAISKALADAEIPKFLGTKFASDPKDRSQVGLGAGIAPGAGLGVRNSIAFSDILNVQIDLTAEQSRYNLALEKEIQRRNNSKTILNEIIIASKDIYKVDVDTKAINVINLDMYKKELENRRSSVNLMKTFSEEAQKSAESFAKMAQSERQLSLSDKSTDRFGVSGQFGQTNTADKYNIDAFRQQEREAGGRAESGKSMSDSIAEAMALAMAPVVGQIATVVKMIAEFPKLIKNFVEGILDAFAEWDEITESFLNDLPGKIIQAFEGVGKTIGNILSQKTIEQMGEIVQAMMQAVKNGVMAAFGAEYDQGQTPGQTKELESLVQAIEQEQKSIERAGWTNADWQKEVTRIGQEKEGLNRKQTSFWEDFIDLSKSQFDALKELNSTQVQSLSVLKGVLNSLEDTINSLLGSTLNPDQTFASAQAAYNDLVEKAISGGLTSTQREQAVGDLTGFVTGFLEKAQEQFGSSAAFQNIFATVLTDLERIKTVTSGEVATSEVTAGNTNSQREALRKEIENAAKEDQTTTNFLADFIKTVEKFFEFIKGAFGTLIALFKSVINIFENIFDAIKNLPQSIADAISGGLGDAAGGLGDILGGVGDVLGFANGGVSTGPQLAMVSEGRYMNEAHVPLPDGRNIPVTITSQNSGNNRELVRELRVQNQLLMEIRTAMQHGLTIDGRKFSQAVSGIASETFQIDLNRNRLGAIA